MERLSIWRDKTCLKCMFNIKDMCRRFPPTQIYISTSNIEAAAYPSIAIWTAACAEYKEPS